MANEPRVTVWLDAKVNPASVQAAAEQIAAGAGGGGGGGGRSPRIGYGTPPLTSETRAAQKDARQRLSDQGKVAAGLGFLASPITNPTSLWGNLLSGVALQRALSTQQGQRLLGRIGMAGGGGTMAATGLIVAGAAGVGLALQGLKKTIEETSRAIERATKLYAFKGMTGFSDQLASQRTTAAGILGVSTNEVMRFGAAMHYLNPRLAEANANFARTYRTLTLVSWNWKIMETNFESLFTTIAFRAAPTINGFAKAITGLITVLDKAMNTRLFRMALAAAFPLTTLGSKVLGAVGGAGEAPIGPTGQVPKRSSAWEKMGLVIGGPMGADRTNDLLRAQLRTLQKIHAELRSNIPRGTSPLNPNFHVNNLPRSA